MGILRISLFGTVQVRYDDLPVRLTPTLQALLGYLILGRTRMHSRELLAGLMWGDLSQEKARSCLNTALWRLRRSLEPTGIPSGTYLLATENEIGFNPEGSYWLDVAAFSEYVEGSIPRPVEAMLANDVGCLCQALQLYQGELMEGFYEDWVLRQREQLRLVYLSGLAKLVDCYNSQHDYEKGLQAARQILALDPLREEIHRKVMKLYLASGQSALAARQYEICQKALEEELGIAPMPETRALYAQVVGSTADSAAGLAGSFLKGEEPPNLRRAMRLLYHARDQVQQAIQYLERVIEQHD